MMDQNVKEKRVKDDLVKVLQVRASLLDCIMCCFQITVWGSPRTEKSSKF